MPLAGIQAEFSNGPPIKAFGGDASEATQMVRGVVFPMSYRAKDSVLSGTLHSALTSSQPWMK